MEKENFKLKFFYFVRFFADALFYPFMSLYLINKGVSETNLGFLLAITPIMTIIVNPIWTYIVKDMRISRILLQAMTVVEGVLIFSLTKVSSLEAYALIIAMIAVLCSPYVSIQDGFASTFANNNRVEYSSIRIYASISYVIATLAGAYLGQYIGYDLLFLLAGIMFAATAFIAIWIKPLDKTTKETVRKKRDFKSLFRNVDFYKYLIFYTLVIGSVRIGDSFFGVYLMEDFGISMIQYGWLYSAFVLVEVLIMRFLMVRGSHYNDKTLFIVAGILFVFRFLVYSLEPSLPIIFAVTLLRGAGWGIILYAHVKFIIKIVKVENVTSAILIVTLLFSIYTGIGNFISGSFIERVGYPRLYMVNMALIFLGLLIFIVFTPKIKQSETGEVVEDNHVESN